MTGLLPLGRVVTRCIAPKSSQFLTRQIVPTSVLRVSYNDLTTSSYIRGVKSVRAFSSSASSWDPETATKPVGRPKAHTGRAPAKKRTVKSTSTSTSTKRAAAGSKGGSKKSVKKPKVASKAKAKPKPKVKPKPRSKRHPSKTSIARGAAQKRKELKEKALLDEPKRLPEAAWLVYSSQHAQKGQKLQDRQNTLKELAVSYQSIAPEERERINHIVNQNKKQNDINRKEWLSKYTPTQIKEANNARTQLLNTDTKQKTRTTQGYAIILIKDDRLVKQPRNSFIYYRSERLATGDYKGMDIRENSKLIASEWKELSAEEKKPYEDKAAEDLNRYSEEVKTVYGTDVPPPVKRRTPKAKTTTAPTSST